jgi:cytochrome c5
MMRKALSLVMVLGIVVSSVAAAGAATAGRTGQQVYESVCKACHGTGISGAPKFGDKIWLQLEKKEGIKELGKDAIKGERAMPPKGGCAACTDEEVRAAVKYMIDSAK